VIDKGAKLPSDVLRVLGVLCGLLVFRLIREHHAEAQSFFEQKATGETEESNVVEPIVME
jgi:hypothetical protein